MNRRFLFEGKTTRAIVEYDAEDMLLCKVEFLNGDDKAKDWFLKNIALHPEDIGHFLQRAKGQIRAAEMAQDLSFVRFWELYGYKIGKKEKVIQLWQALSDEDRAKCLAKIPIYKQWLAQKPNMERLYPQTFLSQRRWENEFRL